MDKSRNTLSLPLVFHGESDQVMIVRAFELNRQLEIAPEDYDRISEIPGLAGSARSFLEDSWIDFVQLGSSILDGPARLGNIN